MPCVLKLCCLLVANFKRSVGDVNVVEQPYKYNTVTAAATGVAYNNNNNNNTLPNNKTNGFVTAPVATPAAAAASAAAVTSHIDKSTGQPVPAPRRTNSVPLGDADGPLNGAASTSSGDSGEAQVRY